MTRVAVVGVTAWGLTLAQLFAHAGSAVSLLARDEEEAETVRHRRTEPRRIAAVRLPPQVSICAAPEDALGGAEVVVLAVPSQALRANGERIAPAAPRQAALVSAAKGIELSSGLRMTEVMAQVLPQHGPACALSGPNLAEEIARGLPAATVVAGPASVAELVQGALG